MLGDLHRHVMLQFADNLRVLQTTSTAFLAADMFRVLNTPALPALPPRPRQISCAKSETKPLLKFDEGALVTSPTPKEDHHRTERISAALSTLSRFASPRLYLNLCVHCCVGVSLHVCSIVVGWLSLTTAYPKPLRRHWCWKGCPW